MVIFYVRLPCPNKRSPFVRNTGRPSSTRCPSHMPRPSPSASVGYTKSCNTSGLFFFLKCLGWIPDPSVGKCPSVLLGLSLHNTVIILGIGELILSNDYDHYPCPVRDVCLYKGIIINTEARGGWILSSFSLIDC